LEHDLITAQATSDEQGIKKYVDQIKLIFKETSKND
jgi:hypothetical protein